MISEIDNKMYELMTEEQNFEFANYIYNNYKDIVDRLKNEFLIELQSKIIQEFNEYSIKEVNYYYEICVNKFKKVKFYFYIWNEKFHYGFILSNKWTKIKIKDTEKLFNHFIQNKDYINDLHSDKNYYYYYKTEDENFNELSNLKKLLPKNRDELIKEYCQKIIKLINEESEEINKFEEIF